MTTTVFILNYDTVAIESMAASNQRPVYEEEKRMVFTQPLQLFIKSGKVNIWLRSKQNLFQETLSDMILVLCQNYI